MHQSKSIKEIYEKSLDLGIVNHKSAFFDYNLTYYFDE